MCPKIDIRDVEDPYEAVDAVASVSMKHLHKKFGQWMRELANIVHTYYTPELKGKWQALWTIATRAFSFGYRGYSVERTIEICREIAREFNVDISDFEEFVRNCYELGARYGERRAKRPKTEAQG